MARTERNRKTTPKGWTVRDGGELTFNGEVITWVSNPDLYDRAPKYRRPFHRCEVKGERVIDWRKYRHRVNQMVYMGKDEEIMPPTRTSGWLSW